MYSSIWCIYLLYTILIMSCILTNFCNTQQISIYIELHRTTTSTYKALVIMSYLFLQKYPKVSNSIDKCYPSLMQPICFIWLYIEQCALNTSAREKTIECARACVAQYGWLLPITLEDEIRFNNVLYISFVCSFYYI